MRQPLAWTEVGRLEDIPRQGARVVETGRGRVALFRTLDDAVYALEDRCPHRDGPLSQGIVHGHCVTCPLHDWIIDLRSGRAQGGDEGATGVVPVRLEGGRIALGLPAYAAEVAAGG